MASVRSKGSGGGDAGPDKKADPAVDEAIALLQQLESDLEALTRYVTEETATLQRKGSTPKRAARLRLVGEDVASAARLARKALKG
jgi:hypothetical protein